MKLPNINPAAEIKSIYSEAGVLQFVTRVKAHVSNHKRKNPLQTQNYQHPEIRAYREKVSKQERFLAQAYLKNIQAQAIHVSAWKNMSGWTPDQCIISANATGGSSYNSGSRTTLFNGELIFGYTFPLGSASPGTGFNQLSFVNGDLDEFQIQTTAGSVATTFTSTSSANWLATMVTFAPLQTQNGSSAFISGAAISGKSLVQ